MTDEESVKAIRERHEADFNKYAEAITNDYFWSDARKDRAALLKIYDDEVERYAARIGELTRDWQRLYIALDEIRGMIGEPDMTDAQFAQEAERIANVALSPSEGKKS